MLTKYATIEMYDVTADFSIGPNFTHYAGIIPVWYKTDVLTVGLRSHDQPHLLRNGANLKLGHTAQRETQIIELILRRRKQEIALIPRRISRAVKLCTRRPFDAADIMASRKAIGTKLACKSEQVSELYAHIAAHAGNWGSSCHIFIREMVDDRFSEPAFMVEHIMRNAKLICYGACIADILTGAACPCPLYSAAMVIKLQGDANRFCARPCGKGRYYRRINATRHSDDDSLAA